MIKKIILLLSLIAVCSCCAQSGYKPIDTTNVAFKAKLKQQYNQRAAKTRATYNSFTDKTFRKALNDYYTELNTEFIEKVDDGHFVQDAFYDERINTLFKQIVAANAEYKGLEDSRILLSFADVPNAYAMGDGFVVVYLPLLARVGNEYELAFIICHELSHNLLNHPQGGLQDYARVNTSKEIKQKTREIEKKKYNKTEVASGLYRDIIYSNRKKHRGVEYQADSLGFVLYKNAFAGKEAMALNSLARLDVMDKEQDSLLPADYEKLFTSEKQPFKPEWLSGDEISSYKYDKSLKFWQIDSLKTHPDCQLRAARLKATFNITGENQTIATDYADVVHRAEYDTLLGLYVLKEYGKSLYQTLLLLKDKPEDPYLRGMVYNNFIKIQEAQKNYTMNKYVETVNPRYSYSYNAFLSFIRQLRKSELTQIINQYQSKI